MAVVVEEDVSEALRRLRRSRAPRLNGGGGFLSHVCRDLSSKVLISRYTSASRKS